MTLILLKLEFKLIKLLHVQTPYPLGFSVGNSSRLPDFYGFSYSFRHL